MRNILGVIGFGALLVTAFSGAAAASTYVWKDNVHGFTFSFPDSWTIQTEDLPATRIRIAGPLAEDFATCRVKSQKDGRLQIYPKSLMTEAVSETLDRSFWEHEIDGYESAAIADYFAPAGMGGKGDATAIRTAFVEGKGKDRRDMYGEMIASIYADTLYVVSCSSKAAEFGKYAPVFATIMGSVDLNSKYNPFAAGYYRDFLSDEKLMLPRSKPGTVHPKNTFQLWSGH